MAANMSLGTTPTTTAATSTITARTEATARIGAVSALWAVARVWVGWQFLTASLSKIGDPAWTGAHAGRAVRGFLGFAISARATSGLHPQVLEPYAWLTKTVLLSQAPTLSYLVTAGEFLVGVTLILGFCTRAAALGGAFLNLIYMLSGSAGLNVPMFAIGLSIVLVGTMAGTIGVDAVARPYLRTLLAHRVGPRGGKR